MRSFRLLSALLLVAVSVSPASACRCRRARRSTCRQVVSRPVLVAPPATAPAAQMPVTYAAPSSSAWVNSPLARINEVRARHGLSALAYDAGLANLARANSAAGFGHNGFHRGWEAVSSSPSIEASIAMWLASPAHRVIILGPGRSAAVETVGSVTTFQMR